jgi:hypothetical protein
MFYRNAGISGAQAIMTDRRRLPGPGTAAARGPGLPPLGAVIASARLTCTRHAHPGVCRFNILISELTRDAATRLG